MCTYQYCACGHVDFEPCAGALGGNGMCLQQCPSTFSAPSDLDCTDCMMAFISECQNGTFTLNMGSYGAQHLDGSGAPFTTPQMPSVPAMQQPVDYFSLDPSTFADPSALLQAEQQDLLPLEGFALQDLQGDFFNDFAPFSVPFLDAANSSSAESESAVMDLDTAIAELPPIVYPIFEDELGDLNLSSINLNCPLEGFVAKSSNDLSLCSNDLDVTPPNTLAKQPTSDPKLSEATDSAAGSSQKSAKKRTQVFMAVVIPSQKPRAHSANEKPTSNSETEDDSEDEVVTMEAKRRRNTFMRNAFAKAPEYRKAQLRRSLRLAMKARQV